MPELHVEQTCSISTATVCGAHVLQVGAGTPQAGAPHEACTDGAPIANTVKRAIAVNVVFILFSP